MSMVCRVYRLFAQVVCLPILLSDFMAKETSREYGIGFWRKVWLVALMIRNNVGIISGSSFLEHLVIARRSAHTRVGYAARAAALGCLRACGGEKMSWYAALRKGPWGLQALAQKRMGGLGSEVHG